MTLSTKQALINLVAAVDGQHNARIPDAERTAKLSQALFDASQAVIADNGDEQAANARRWCTMAQQMVDAINAGGYAEPGFFEALDTVSEPPEGTDTLTLQQFNVIMDEALSKGAK